MPPVTVAKLGPTSPRLSASKRHNERSDKAHVDKAKNVSHVPCKFFRQSMCQAGDKCPFSHELDSQAQAVCKYFQKGNCKFGAKCALAHITPEGRHINKKSPNTKEAKRKEKLKDEDGHADHIPIAETPRTPQAQAILSSPKLKTGSASSQNSDVTIVDPSVEMASRILSKYSGFPQHVNIGAKPFATVRSLSTTAQATRPNSGWGTLAGFPDGSAIVDDDEDTLEDDETLEEEEGYQEQLVPSTLEDLLTPTERERRHSRTSQAKSGRVFSTPSSATAPIGLPPRHDMSETFEQLSLSAPTSDLWGPRPRPVAPFYRAAPSGSASSPVSSPGNAQAIGSPPSSSSSPGHSQAGAIGTTIGGLYQSSGPMYSTFSAKPPIGSPQLGSPSQGDVLHRFQQYPRVVVPTEKI